MNRCLALVTLAGVTIMTGSLRASDWPRWRGPDLDGISKETGWSDHALAGEPKILWRADLGTGFSSFSVANGRVYTAGNTADTDTIFCLDAETGRDIWKYSYAEPLNPSFYEGGTSATPTVAGDTVYILSRTGHLAALDAVTGAIRWKKNIAVETGAKPPKWGFAGSPFIVGDLLVVNVGRFGTALSKKTGQVVWSTGTNESGYATPVPFEIEGEKELAVFGGRELAAVSLLAGRVKWTFPWKTEYDLNASQPIISGKQIFLSSGNGTGGGLLDFSGGRPVKVWTNQNMHALFNSCVLLNGFLYGISGQAGHSGDSGLACVEWATGQRRWFEKSVMFGAVAATPDRLIVMGEKGELVIAEVNPERFVAISRGQVLGGRCWTTPVLANGRIFVRNSKGDMVCVDVKG